MCGQGHRAGALTALVPAAAGSSLKRVRSAAAEVLSPREPQVLRFAAKGLFITEATVKSHLLNLHAKLEAGSRHRGLLAPSEQRFSP